MNFQFDSLQDLLTMDGHGSFVWLAVGVTLFILLWLVVAPIRRRKVILQEVVREIRREQARQQVEENS